MSSRGRLAELGHLNATAVRGSLVVGTIIRESLATTLRFTAWYLDQGAANVVLFLDDPEDPAIPWLQTHERVTCVPCTDALWRSLGLTPETRFTLRQNRAMQAIYDALSVGWFLNVDGDELLRFEGRTIAEVLADTPATVEGIRVRPAEYIQTPETNDATYFRLPMRRWARRRVYGAEARVMSRREGLAGQNIGKSITRAGISDAVVRQHWLQRPDATEIVDLTMGAADGAHLLHFVDQGYDVWRRKVEWRLSSRGFRQVMRQRIAEILAGPDPEAGFRNLYQTVYVFDPERLAELCEVRACLRLELDLDSPLRRHFPKASGIVPAEGDDFLLGISRATA